MSLAPYGGTLVTGRRIGLGTFVGHAGLIGVNSGRRASTADRPVCQMSHRFPTLSAPLDTPDTLHRRLRVPSVPNWLRSLPIAEFCVLGAAMMILAIA